MTEIIRRAIKDGSFWYKAFRKIHRTFHLYYISNKNIEFQVNTSRVYDKYAKKYAGIIREGVEVREASEFCNKVWVCWFQGEENAPTLVKACISSLRRNLSDRELIVLSEKNIADYVAFPEYINEKWKSGRIGPAHYSDILRTELLCRYGGIWIDSTVFCSSRDIPDYILSAPLFVYKQLDLIHEDINPIVASSWLISAYSNTKIMLLVRKLLLKYWSENKSLKDYFLFHVFFAMASRRYADDWNAVPTLDNHSAHVMALELGSDYDEKSWERLTKLTCFHKLNHYNDFSNCPKSIYNHIIEKYT